MSKMSCSQRDCTIAYKDGYQHIRIVPSGSKISQLPSVLTADQQALLRRALNDLRELMRISDTSVMNVELTHVGDKSSVSLTWEC